MTIPVILLPAEVQLVESAAQWALASIKRNAGELAKTDPYGGTEAGILYDQVWFARYLVALARLTPEGRHIVEAARGEHDEP